MFARTRGRNHKHSRTDLPRRFGPDRNGHLWRADEGPLDLNVFSLLLHVELQLLRKKKKIIGGLLSSLEPQNVSVCSFVFLDRYLSPPWHTVCFQNGKEGPKSPDLPFPVV